METLALVIIVAFATSYVTEVLAVWLQRLSFIKTLTNLLIPPLAFFAFWLLDMRDVPLILSTLERLLFRRQSQLGFVHYRHLK